MTIAIVNPGICGMTATVEVTKVSKRRVEVEITSECEKVAEMSQSLPALSLFDALKPQVDSRVYRYASQCCLCTSCPVPMAVLKAIEVEGGLALPQSVLVNFESKEYG